MSPPLAETAGASSPYRFKQSPYSSHALLTSLLPAPGEGRRVLDVGCADGYLSQIFAARGYQVTGIEGPGRAGPHFPPEVRLIEADLDQGLPRLASRFDAIVCADVLEHLRDPLKLLLDLHGALAPGGALIVSLPNSGHAWFRLNILAGRFPQDEKGLFDRTHLHFYMWRGWVDLFGRAGLRFEAVRTSGVPVGLALPRLEGTLIVRALERMSYDLARFWKTLFAYQFIAVARPEAQS